MICGPRREKAPKHVKTKDLDKVRKPGGRSENEV
jgi:hypothetical protein